ncbi:MAG: hypothetical protein AAF989_15415, partial [Planctomycetota bacterium]
MSNNEISNRQIGSPSAVMQPLAFMDVDPSESAQNEMPNIGAAMWRYRWAVALPTMLGIVAGFLLFLRTNETYRSTTKLMIESDRPAVMDTMTGEVVGGVPSIEIVQAQLFSDDVINGAYYHEKMVRFHESFDEGFADFVELVKVDECLELEPEVSDVKTAQSVVALLHFDSPDEELSQAAVQAFSDSLQDYYDSKYSDTRDDLKEFIDNAIDKIQPKLEAYENEYAMFRKESSLDFDENNNAINPHRLRSRELMIQRSKLKLDYVDAALVYESIKQTVEGAKDPVVALTTVSGFLDKPLQLPQHAESARLAMGAEDAELARLEVREELAPMKSERDSLAAEFGVGHPSVKVFDTRIASLEKRLESLGEDRSTRLTTLLDEEERETENARDAIMSVQTIAKIEVDMIKQRLTLLEKEIKSESALARGLANSEVEYIALQEKIKG